MQARTFKNCTQIVGSDEFTNANQTLFSAGGKELYWESPSFEDLGSAYDDVVN